jgi:hypothetical protein
MKNRVTTRCRLGLGLLMLAALTLVLVTAQARAADYNLDGFDDGEPSICSHEQIQSGTCSLATAYPLNPQMKNLFVIIWPKYKDPSLPSYLPSIPSDPNNPNSPPDPTPSLEFAWDLGINLIQLPRSRDYVPPSNPNIPPEKIDRQVYPGSLQLADKIKEDNLTTGDKVLGWTMPGPPSGLDNAVIYTAKIRNMVEANNAGAPRIELIDPSTSSTTVRLCWGSGTIPNSTTPCAALSAANDQIIKFHAKNTVAHELAHEVNLRNPPDSRLATHYAVGTGVILDSATQCTITYAKDKVTKTRVTWFIATKYAAGDRTNLMLVQ